jgi:hypothetical protein
LMIVLTCVPNVTVSVLIRITLLGTVIYGTRGLYNQVCKEFGVRKIFILITTP